VISDALVALKWEDSLKYTTMNVRTSYANNGYFVMNRKRYASLPADVQKIVDELSDEYAVKMSRLWDEKEAEAIAALKARGHTTIALSAEEEEKWVLRIEPVYEGYVKEKSARGLPAAEALRFSREWVARKQQ
jgi:TRAP-type C4-dicarboxylate transport system substrate-binding protein